MRKILTAVLLATSFALTKASYTLPVADGNGKLWMAGDTISDGYRIGGPLDGRRIYVAYEGATDEVVIFLRLSEHENHSGGWGAGPVYDRYFNVKADGFFKDAWHYGDKDPNPYKWRY